MVVLSASFVSLALLASSALAAPFSPSSSIQQLPLKKSFHLNKVKGNGTTLFDLDTQRASALISSLLHGGSSGSSKRATGSTGPLTYTSVMTATTYFETPGESLTLVVDTTLGLTFVRESKDPNPTSEGTFELSNGISGTMTYGTIYVENGSGSSSALLNYGVVDDSYLSNFDSYDGVLGFAPGISWTTEPDSEQATLETFMEALGAPSSGQSFPNIFAISFNLEPVTQNATYNQEGTLYLGLGDTQTPSTYQNALADNNLWGVGDVTITYGSSVLPSPGWNITGPSFYRSKRHIDDPHGKKSKNEATFYEDVKVKPSDYEATSEEEHHPHNPPHGGGGKGGGGSSTQRTAKTLLQSGTGVFDTGTTLFLLESSAYQAYQTATGATYDPATKMLKITSEQYSKLQPVYFTFSDGTQFEFVPNAQIWPRALNSKIGGSTDSIYLIFGQLPSTVPSSLDLAFIAGSVFSQRFAIQYDNTGSPSTVGIATTSFTDSSNIN